ncbi:MAG: type III pantothenate kinase [Aquificae bacterium]|nr:type III pantothenate kinase [Aquificota bacterium]
MLVGIDIGNTTVEFGFIYSLNRIHTYRLKTDKGKTSDDWLLDISHILSLEGNPEVEACLVSSVVPIVEDRIGEGFLRATGKKPIFVGKDIPVPIKNRYANPEEVGIDRLVNGFAVSVKYGFPAVVVDFGTAITFDVVNERGEYEGGAIFPGIDASISALFSKTAKLPSVNLKGEKKVIGKTTVDSIRSGIYFGYVSLVEGMVERINREAGYGHKIILTGGGGKLISEGLSIPYTYDKYLPMKGLYLVYQAYRKGS